MFEITISDSENLWCHCSPQQLSYSTRQTPKASWSTLWPQVSLCCLLCRTIFQAAVKDHVFLSNTRWHVNKLWLIFWNYKSLSLVTKLTWEYLTWSLPWITRGRSRLSQLVTGADHPRDRRLSTMRTTWRSFIMTGDLTVSVQALRLGFKATRFSPH